MTKRQWRKHCALEAVAGMDNLWRAAELARRGKSRRPDVEAWWMRRERELRALREELLGGGYRPGPYHFFEIRQPKRRMIAAAPFRDRVVHHALCLWLAPVLQRGFVARTFSCQLGKGTGAARECCRRLVNRHQHVLKCDIAKFFPSVDHEILYNKIASRVACDGVMGLVRRILESFRTGPETSARPFPGEGSEEAAQRPRGLPIGNLTSQLWGNFMLDELDHWVAEELGMGAYVRYTDDFLTFSNDKGELRGLLAGMEERLAALRLRLSFPKSRLLATREGVPFCGFRFLPGLQPRILGETKRRFESRRRALVKKRDYARLGVAVFAWYQFSREGNSEGLRRAYAARPLGARPKRRRRGANRVLRGGSWNNNDQDNLLSSNRNNNDPGNRNNNIGFRCVLDCG